jgi:hypothetical protein
MNDVCKTVARTLFVVVFRLKARGRSMAALSFAGALLAAYSAFVLAPSASALPAPPAQPPGLDHFLCYNASTPAGVAFPVIPSQLSNQFPGLMNVTQTSATVDLHCNPATKKVKSTSGAVTTYQAKSPSWHLLCVAIDTAQSPSTHVVKVSDQFGAAKLTTGPPSQFCLPSLKSLGPASNPTFVPPAATETTPDHFTCYPIENPAGGQPFTQIPPVVKVKDQFTGGKIRVQVGPPTMLCLPTQKTLESGPDAGHVTPITNATAHLLCFQVTGIPTPTVGTVYDENQFNQQPFNPQSPGPGFTPIQIGTANSLCLPSYKKLIQ